LRKAIHHLQGTLLQVKDFKKPVFLLFKSRNLKVNARREKGIALGTENLLKLREPKTYSDPPN
jgi:hypothetical protein